MDAMITHRSMKERRMREAARTWRKEGVNWTNEENDAWSIDVGVSKNSGTPKWMVYNGKPY